MHKALRDRCAVKHQPMQSVARMLLLLALAVGLGKPGIVVSHPVPPHPPVPIYGTLPVYFEENLGQTGARVRFLSRARDYTVFLTPQGSVLTLHKRTASLALKGDARRRSQPGFTSASVWLNLAGSRSDVRIEGIDPQPGRVNYFIGNDATRWRTGIPTYARVKYRSVYPGIDLVYYGSTQALEYDLMLAPGANPGVIGIDLQGTDGIRLNKAGDVVMGTAAGNLIMRKPRIYQSTRAGARRELGGRYVLRSKSRVAFEVPAYDRKRPLVIDPVVVLDYSTYLGGSGKGEQANGIAVDASGSAYITGKTWSHDFPTKNAFQATNNTTNETVFVTKFSPGGSSLVYSTYLGGTGSGPDGDQGNGIAVDSGGNAYVTGDSWSHDFPTKNAFQATNKAPAGQDNAFVTKFSAAGSLVYSTYLGGSNYTAGYGIAVDANHSAYVTGVTSSSDFPTKNAFQPTNRASYNVYTAFVTKFSPLGSSLVYSTYLGGSRGSAGLGIKVAGGNAYVTGTTASTDFPLKNPFQATNKTGGLGSNVFVTKFSQAGNSLVYSTYLGGSGNPYYGPDGGTAIAVDAGGNAYVTGFTASIDFPLKSPFQATNKEKGDNTVFVTKFSAGGSSLVYSTYLGGSGSSSSGSPVGDQGNGIAVDTSGSAYVTGTTASTDFPLKNPFQATNKTNGDITVFVTKLSAAGSSLVYSTYLGGSGFPSGDNGTAISVDVGGSAYVTGSTGSFDFPTKNAFQPTNNSGFTVFVTKLSFLTAPTPTATPSRTRTPTVTRKPTATASRKPTPTHTPRRTATRTPMHSPTRTRTPARTPTRTPTRKPTATPSKKPTATPTPRTSVADMTADWSDSKNPNTSNSNGTWEYRQGVTNLPLVSNWNGAGTVAFPATQPALAPSNVVHN